MGAKCNAKISTPFKYCEAKLKTMICLVLLLCMQSALSSKSENLDDSELGEEYLVELGRSQKESKVTMLDSTWNSPKMTWRNHKTVAKFSLYPPENYVKAIRDVKTDEIIWEDSMNLIPIDVKESI